MMLREENIRSLVTSLFGEVHGKTPDELFKQFIAHPFTLEDLHHVFSLVDTTYSAVPHPAVEHKQLRVNSSIAFGPAHAKDAVLLIAQTHGNEPVGLTAILYTMMLHIAGKLDFRVYAAIGNAEAARRYWEQYTDEPDAPVHERSFNRTLSARDEADEPKDLNRIPPIWAAKAKENRTEFFAQSLSATDYVVRRAAKLSALAAQPGMRLVFDPHTARQYPDGLRIINMSERQLDMLEKGELGNLLQGVPEDIRTFPAGLLSKLGMREPQCTIKSLCEIIAPEAVIVGIECGHHENLPDIIPRCVQFANALFFNLGLGTAKPSIYDEDDGRFTKYHVYGRISLSFLDGPIVAGDIIYPVKKIKAGEAYPYGTTHKLVGEPCAMHLAEVNHKHIAEEDCVVVYQFFEMEELEAGRVVMMGVPSGNEFAMPLRMRIMFPTKSAALYGRKPGMWPVVVGDNVEAASHAKFGYGIFGEEHIRLKVKL